MKVRLWNTAALVRDISAGRLSEALSVRYLVALSLLWTAEGYLAVFVTPPLRWSLLFEFLVAAIITLVGIRACYLANGGANGKDFILRFICISLPIQVKLSFIGWALVFVFYRYAEVIFDPTVFADPDRAWNGVTYFWIAAFTSAFYWRVWLHMKMLAGAQPTVQAVPTTPRR